MIWLEPWQNWKLMMRDAFIAAITEAAATDERVMLLTADLGYKLFDRFAEAFPGRFRNLGVSEANMINVATGLALGGWRPFCYSIVPFATLRCLEQIRNGPCNMGLPVTVVGVGAGFAYGVNGATHHGVDDIGAMRALHGMTVVSPCGPAEARAALSALLAGGRPAYLRLGRAGENDLPAAEEAFVLGRPRLLRAGTGVALLACGSVASEALAAAALLAEEAFSPLVLSVHTVKPIAGLAAILAAHTIERVVTVEEHGPCGGLHEAVCAHLAEAGMGVPVARCCAPDTYLHTVGSQAWLRGQAGLTAADLVATVRAHGEAKA